MTLAWSAMVIPQPKELLLCTLTLEIVLDTNVLVEHMSSPARMFQDVLLLGAW